MNIRAILIASVAGLSLIAAGAAEAKGSGGRSGGRSSFSRSTTKPKPYKPWKPATTHKRSGYYSGSGHSESEEAEDCDIEDWFEGDDDCEGLTGPNAF